MADDLNRVLDALVTERIADGRFRVVCVATARAVPELRDYIAREFSTLKHPVVVVIESKD